jgi:hypothetical protein
MAAMLSKRLRGFRFMFLRWANRDSRERELNRPNRLRHAHWNSARAF